MFVYYFCHVAGPFEKARAIFEDHPQRWLPAYLEKAFDRGDALRVTVGIGDGFRLSKDLLVSIGEIRKDEGKVSLPLDVKASGEARLFPHLWADLELARLGEGLAQLTLRGSYKPPLGWVGQMLDRALLHRIAEAAVKDFVEQIAGRLSDQTDLRGNAMGGLQDSGNV
ncbi:MAG TPA: hypothetical protein VI541_03275 [Actinomycetota bacterium]|nr:hypothetical protein [Actinomycetota bacterium]